jgi:hypothetical protein
LQANKEVFHVFVEFGRAGLTRRLVQARLAQTMPTTTVKNADSK